MMPVQLFKFQEQHSYFIGQFWQEFVKIKELVGEGSKTSEKLLGYLVACYEELKELASKTHMKFPRFFEFHLEEKRDSTFKFLPTILQGCVDHQAALFSKRFSGCKWESNSLQTT